MPSQHLFHAGEALHGVDLSVAPGPSLCMKAPIAQSHEACTSTVLTACMAHTNSVTRSKRQATVHAAYIPQVTDDFLETCGNGFQGEDDLHHLKHVNVDPVKQQNGKLRSGVVPSSPRKLDVKRYDDPDAHKKPKRCAALVPRIVRAHAQSTLRQHASSRAIHSPCAVHTLRHRP